MRLIGMMNEEDKQEFKEEVQKQLGLEPGQECDKVCGSLSDEQFQDLIELVKKILKDKKSRRVVEPIYA
jgi:nicotinamide riboside kinase